MIVLDTHVWLWWSGEPSMLSRRAANAIEQESEIGISAISCWELAMLVEHGRLELDLDVLAWMRKSLADPRVGLLPVEPEIAVIAAGFGRKLHGDPADRLISATAIQRRCRLVTKDDRLRRFTAVETVW